MTTPLRAGLVVGAVVILNVVAAFSAGFATGYEYGQKHPGCMEDEVLAVQHDPSPSHGLTWACEGLDDLLEGQR